MSEDKMDNTDLLTENGGEECNAHSDYQPNIEKSEGATHHLSGMYQNWFLDYASYVILD
ncbi:MAG: hypothetical protein IIX35_03920 [Paraprevotella sp.]|nr:hypothetical protein [Paraprevotella sp.]